MLSIQSQRTRIFFLIAAALLILILASGCRGNSSPTPAQNTETPTVAPDAATETPSPTLTASATAVPLSLQVNGQGVSLAVFSADLKLLQQAHQELAKTAAPEEQRQQVADHWIATLLLAQAAEENGFTLDEAALQAEIDRLAAQLGGGENLSAWMAERGYTEAAFREALRVQMAAAWQRDWLTAQVPTAAEQVRARQILTLDEDSANRALAQVRTAGVNFAAQAYVYDPSTGGDLGWFPRGYLTQPEVEEAAFALQPGEVSEVVRSEIGYHIIQVISREPSKALSPDALRVLREKAVEAWLAEQRAAAQVDLNLPVE